MKFNYQRSKQGFTLVEILTALAIIGVLASVVLFAYTEARKKGRDAKRLIDLAKIEEVLGLYHVENGSYPDNFNDRAYGEGGCNNTDGCTNAWFTSFTDTLVPQYISEVPTDPLVKSVSPTNEYPDNEGVYRYDTRDRYDNYLLITRLESYDDYPYCYIYKGDYPRPASGYASLDGTVTPSSVNGWPFSQYGRENIEFKDCHDLMR